VVVTNGAGSATSNAATLTVNSAGVAPSITTQPVSQDVTVGQTATFSVAATGTAPLSYQWQKNGAAISGATSSAYTTPPTTISDDRGLFAELVTNNVGKAISNAGTLNVAAGTAMTVAVSPNSATVATAASQQFTTTVSGNSNTAVTWSVSGAGCSGATCGTININGLYTAPSSVPSPANVTVTAASAANPSVMNSAFVSITPAVSTSSLTIPAGHPRLFWNPAHIAAASNWVANTHYAGITVDYQPID
jgi:hypothetical protein